MFRAAGWVTLVACSALRLLVGFHSLVGGEGLVIEIAADEEQVVFSFGRRGEHDVERFRIAQRITTALLKENYVGIAFVLDQNKYVFLGLVPLLEYHRSCHVDPLVAKKLVILCRYLCGNRRIAFEGDHQAALSTLLCQALRKF